MTRSEAVYENLLRLLTDFVADTPQRDVFINALPEDRQLSFIDLRNEISREISRIDDSRQTGIVHSDFVPLINAFDAIAENFLKYPGRGLIDIRLISIVVEKLANALEGLDPLLETEFDADQFKLQTITAPIKESNFIELGGANISNTLVLFDTREIEMFSDLLDNSNLHSDIYFHLLANLGCENANLKKAQYVLASKAISGSKRKTRATAVLAVVKAGKVAHERVDRQVPLSIPASALLNVGNDYQQFDDTLLILSEYNDETELLGKYLRLYQVFENFMYKSPLVKMERKHDGTVFSIRDFQRMYKNLPSGELAGVQNLFQKLSQDTRSPGPPPITFEQHIRASFVDLHNNQFSGSADKLNKLFEILNIESGNMTYASYIAANTVSNFSKLVYSIRNSIVHNRETEFHLTHETLSRHVDIGDTATIVISDYLLPILEEIAYSAILTPNDKIWFNGDKLTLWKKR